MFDHSAEKTEMTMEASDKPSEGNFNKAKLSLIKDALADTDMKQVAIGVSSCDPLDLNPASDQLMVDLEHNMWIIHGEPELKYQPVPFTNVSTALRSAEPIGTYANASVPSTKSEESGDNHIKTLISLSMMFESNELEHGQTLAYRMNPGQSQGTLAEGEAQ
jgi:hypothetical protein